MLRVDRRDPDFSLTAIHGIDTVRHLARCDYHDIFFRYQDVPGAGPGVANIFLDATLLGGAVASLEFLPVSGVAMERITVVTDGATWVLGMPIGGVDGDGWLRRYSRGVLEWETSGPAVAGSLAPEVLGGFAEESAGFFDALRSGQRPAADFGTARQSVVVAQCIRERRSRFTSR
jgi:myo-inositol 2-dehydrogenase/D-chiro-inositol 1-dehydrogenase